MENSRVIRSAFKVGGFTLMSRVLGLIRDTLTAAAFGTSAAMSDFVVAFRIPNMFRALFGEGALSSAFIPVFVETRTKQGDNEAWHMARKVISLLGVALAIIVAIGMLICTALPLIPGLIGPSSQVLPLARIMLPYMLFICLTALSQGILNSYHRFSLPALTPCLLNLTWIFFVVAICPLLGDTMEERIYGVAWGILAAGLVQLVAQIPSMIKLGYRPGFEIDTKDARVTRFLKLMAPTALGQSVSQINMLVNGLLALWAAPWAPSALYFAERLLYLPQGLLATAMSTVLLPVLSTHAAEGNAERIRSTLNHSLRTLLFVMAPAAAGLFALAHPIVDMLFGWGAFRGESVAHTAPLVRCYAPGLFIFGLAKVFVPVFYALKNTRTPYRIGLVSVLLNFSLNILCTIAGPPEIKAAGLAIAAVVSEAFNGFALAWCLHKIIGSPGWREIATSAARAVACAVVMAVVVYFLQSWAIDALRHAGIATKIAQIVSVMGSIAIGAALYFGMALILRSPEAGNVIEALKRRRARKVE